MTIHTRDLDEVMLRLPRVAADPDFDGGPLTSEEIEGVLLAVRELLAWERGEPRRNTPSARRRNKVARQPCLLPRSRRCLP